MRKQLQRVLLIFLVAMLVAGCSTVSNVFSNKKADYRNAKRAPQLEIPPDLTTSSADDGLVVPDTTATPSANLSDYEKERKPSAVTDRAAVLVQPSDIQVRRDGDRQWLVAESSAAALWPKIRQFWIANGFVIDHEDPRIGILETGWSENRADIPQDPVRRLIGKALDSIYSAGTRDRFRVRMERGSKKGTTEIYLTHRGMEEVVQGSPEDNGGTVWKPRPSDPELEVEMLKRMMVYMGVQEQRAASQLAHKKSSRPKARFVGGKAHAELLLSEEFPKAWRSVGVALDRGGFLVEDRDRSKGLYFVRYDDLEDSERKSGLLSKMAFWRSKKKTDGARRMVNLNGIEKGTRVRVLDANGKPDNSATAKRLLSLLKDQLQ